MSTADWIKIVDDIGLNIFVLLAVYCLFRKL